MAITSLQIFTQEARVCVPCRTIAFIYICANWPIAKGHRVEQL